MPVLLRRPDVQQRTGLSRSSLYNLIKEGRFPRPVQISDRSVAWVSDDIDVWINTRIKNGQTITVGERVKPTFLSNLKEWAVPGFKDTLLRCLMEPEVFDGATQEVF